MSKSKSEKLYNTLVHASRLMQENYYDGMPIIALRMLLYINIQTREHNLPVYVADMTKEFDTYPEKIYRNVRRHMKTYVTCSTTEKEGSKKPVLTFELSRWGIDYLTSVTDNMD